MNYQGYYPSSVPPPPPSEGNVSYPGYHQPMKSHSPSHPSYPHQPMHQPTPNDRTFSGYNPMPTTQNYTNHSGYNHQPPMQPNYPGYPPTASPSNNMMNNYPPSHPSSSYETPINAYYGPSSSMPPNNYSNNTSYTSNLYEPPPRNHYVPYNNSSPHSAAPKTEYQNVPYNSSPNSPPPSNEYKSEPYSSNSPTPRQNNMSNKRAYTPENYSTGMKSSDIKKEEGNSPEPNKKKCYENISGATSFANLSSNVDHTLPLNNGKTIPVVQFGTYKMKGPDAKTAILAALRAGYKGLDTASVYDNEKEVGEAIMASGIPRENLFIQTKLWRSFCGRGKNGKPKCDTELNKSIKKLGTKYIDCWLMHWPGPGRHLNYPPVRQGMDRPKVKIEGNASKMVPEDWTPAMRLDTYKEMAKHVGSNVKSLGVCNFSVRQLEELLAFCNANNIPKPAVVQNECHPLLIATDVRNFCAQEGIVFQAYASLGAGSLGLMDNPVVKMISANHSITPAQVLLRWGVQLGCALLPKSSNSERQKTNLDIWSFKLSEEDMLKLSSCDKSVKGQNTMAGWLREHDPDFY